MVELKPHRAAVIAEFMNDAVVSGVGRPRIGRQSMNWDQIQVNWTDFKGKVRNNWVKLTDEDITRIAGRRTELASRLRARYGFAKAEADREIEAWTKAQRLAA
jgi:uncharacterized protein YjbJ (UPF0337 family)